MRIALAVSSLLFVTASAFAQTEPVYLDVLTETPVSELRTTFSTLKKEGCYRIGEDRYLMITIDKKDQKPWRVILANEVPCRRAETGPALDVQLRKGVQIGDSQVSVVQRLGRPDTANPPEPAQKKLGDTEFLYICRVSPECARHTSVFIKAGVVSAMAEWYSE